MPRKGGIFSIDVSVISGRTVLADEDHAIWSKVAEKLLNRPVRFFLTSIFLSLFEANSFS